MEFLFEFPTGLITVLLEKMLESLIPAIDRQEKDGYGEIDTPALRENGKYQAWPLKLNCRNCVFEPSIIRLRYSWSVRFWPMSL